MRVFMIKSGSARNCRTKRAVAALVAVICVVSSGASSAADTLKCTSAEEVAAFRLRHLQSKLMVAALGCNQQAAYNTFVESFRTPLVSAGGLLTDYFVRHGGQPALNRHITELANAAGLSRAEDPNGFCTQTWQLFWNLEQDPQALAVIADANVMLTIPHPPHCAVSVVAQTEAAPENATAAFDAAKAAAEQPKN
jgi:hypothetical protein